MNILWFCNRPIEEAPDRRDGTWFTAMARALSESTKIRLSVLSQSGVGQPVRRDCGNIAQWLFPREPLLRHGLPSHRTTKAIQRVVNEISPDLIHIWGTEHYWGLLTARGIIPGPAVLEIQGIKYVCAPLFYGGLSMVDRLRCIGPLEIAHPPSHIFFGKQRFLRWGTYEKEMIVKHEYVSTQSDWVESHVLKVNPRCTLFRTGILLRRQFYDADPWVPMESPDTAAPRVLVVSSGPMAYKGLHIVFRAIAVLKRYFPRISLSVAGNILRSGIHRSGYSHWLLSEARRLAIERNIHWLGPLDAQALVRQLQRTSVVVVPSLVESYSVVLAEAMVVGAPLVVSYAGAMPELARDGESALFFPPGDEVACAIGIERILNDSRLARRLSRNAREVGLVRNNPASVVQRQLSIYQKVLKNTTCA